MLYVLSWDPCTCDFSMRLWSQDHYTSLEAVTQREVARVVHTSQETSDTQEKNNQLASGNTRASKACKPVYGHTARASTSWPSLGISIIAEAQP
jgi:hypothetical protein